MEKPELIGSWLPGRLTWWKGTTAYARFNGKLIVIGHDTGRHYGE